VECRLTPVPCRLALSLPSCAAEALAAQRADLVNKMDAVTRALEDQLAKCEAARALAEARSEELQSKFQGFRETLTVGDRA
jgi:hypothetical protein